MITLQQNSPQQFKEEILHCIVENGLIKNEPGKPDIEKYEEFLRDQFLLVNGDYDNPDYTSLLKVMKLLAARELKNGKSTRVIAQNFLGIANRIKGKCGVC